MLDSYVSCFVRLSDVLTADLPCPYIYIYAMQTMLSLASEVSALSLNLDSVESSAER